MVLISLTLTDFRNYKKKYKEFSQGINVVWGRNAAGKTNLLEAIYLLSTGESFKAGVTEEMVRFGADMAIVEGIIGDGNGTEEVSIILSNGSIGGKKTSKKRFMIEGAPKRKKDFVGIMPAVIFRPEDMELLVGTSVNRRRLIDMVLSQSSPTYARVLTLYEQAVRRRNRLLSEIKNGIGTRSGFIFWEEAMVKNGTIVTEKRREFVEFVNDLWSKSELFNKLNCYYDKSVVSRERFEEYYDREKACGYSLIGPHKDDFRVIENDLDLATYGSRGEQRMAVLAIKTAEIYFLRDKLEAEPLLLLDDIFSELDENHKAEVLRVMKNRQVVVTTAVREDINLFEDAQTEQLL